MTLDCTPPVPAKDTIESQSNYRDLAYRVDQSVHWSLGELRGLPSAVSRSFIDKFSEKLPKLGGLLDISPHRPNDVRWSPETEVTQEGGQQVRVRMQNMDAVSGSSQ